MADIFISYAREDWWDRHILAGKEFDEVIQREIDAARSVVVVWSRHSVSSRWVKAEADEGARRRILVPIAIDESSAVIIGEKELVESDKTGP